MRAVWYDRQGPANEVIVQGELPTPEPGTGEVRVRLEASGVNPSDTYRRRGAVPAEYPRVIPNSDGAGVIDKVGAMVPERWVGKRVWLYNGQRNGRWMGTAAEYICLARRSGDRTALARLVRRGCDAGRSRHDRAWLRLRGRTVARQDRSGDRWRRRGRPLRRATRRLGRRIGDRDGQFGRQSGAGARRAARHISSTTGPRTSPRASATSPAANWPTMSSMSISAAIWPPCWLRCATAAASRITRRTERSSRRCRCGP